MRTKAKTESAGEARLCHTTPERSIELSKPPPSNRLVSEVPHITGNPSFVFCVTYYSYLFGVLTCAVHSPHLPMSRVHFPPHRADPPDSPEHRRTSALSPAVHHVTCCVRNAVCIHHLYVPLWAATYALPNLRSACHLPHALLVSRVPASMSVANVTTPPNSGSHVSYPPSRSTDNFDVDYVMYADNVVCPVLPCCMHGNVS